MASGADTSKSHTLLTESKQKQRQKQKNTNVDPVLIAKIDKLFQAAKTGDRKNAEEAVKEALHDAALYSEDHKLLKESPRATTALHVACQNGDEGLCKYLIKLGIVINKKSWVFIKDEEGMTTLHHAAKHGNAAVCRLLCDYKHRNRSGNDLLTKKDNEGKIPLHYSAEYGHYEVCNDLMDQKTDDSYVNVKDKKGKTPLHYVSIQGNRDEDEKDSEPEMTDVTKHDVKGVVEDNDESRQKIAEILIEHGAKVDEENNDDSQPEMTDVTKHGANEVANEVVEENDDGQPEMTDVTKHGANEVVEDNDKDRKNIAEMLIEHGAKMDEEDNYNKTPAHYAAGKQGHIGVFQILIERKLDVLLSKDKLGNTPMHVAAEAGRYTEIVLLVIAKIKDRTSSTISATDSKGTTMQDAPDAENLVETTTDNDPVKENRDEDSNDATKRGRVPFARDLPAWMRFGKKQRGMNVIQKNEKMNADMVDAKNDQISQILNAKNDKGKTPLHVFASGGHIEACISLLKMDLVKVDQDNAGKTPLHDAAEHDREEVCKILMENEKMRQKDRKGKTALHVAAKKNSIKACRGILDGAEKVTDEYINIADEDGKIALHYASQKGCLEICRLIAKKSDITKADKVEKIALHYASEEGHLEICRLLAEKDKSAVNTTDKAGKTSLHYASGNGQAEICKCLADISSVYINIQDNEGKIPLHLASEHAEEGYKQICELLAEKSMLNLKDDHHTTPLQVAAQKNHLEICQILAYAGSKKIEEFEKFEDNVKSAKNLATHEPVRAFLREILENQKMVWIKGSIKLRRCKSYSEKSVGEETCGCGLKHKDKPEGEWTVADNTTTSHTDAFGKIQFDQDRDDQDRKYVRLDYATDENDIVKLLRKMWDLTPPKLIISLISGDNDKISESEQNMLKQDVIGSTLATGTWILTDATHCGLTPVVGEAVQIFGSTSNKVVAFGITTWGNLDNGQRKLLTKTNVKNPVTLETPRSTTTTMLNSNLTHYLLVDNGTFGKPAPETMEFWSKLEKTISKHEEFKETNNGIICIVFKGDMHTLEKIKNTLNNKTHVILMKESGGIAGLLSKFYEKSRVEDGDVKMSMRRTFNKGLEKLAEEARHKDPEDKRLTEDFENLMKECLKQREYLHVHTEGDVLKRTTKVLMQDIDELESKIDLCISLNNVEEVESLLKQVSELDENYNGRMHRALVNKQVQIVDLFLRRNFDLKKYLTVEELKSLYQETSSTSWLCELFKIVKTPEDLLTSGRASDSTQVPPDSSKSAKGTSRFLGFKKKISTSTKKRGILKYVDLLVKRLTVNTYKPPYTDIEKSETFQLPEKELFIYAVLNEIDKLAELFWKKIKADPIGAALVASVMFKSIALEKCDKKDKEREKKLEIMASEYENRAIGLLRLYYNDEKKGAIRLIHSELSNWGNETCLTLAAAASNRNFIAHPAVQDSLKKIWHGALSNKMQTNTDVLKLVACIVCPLFVPFRKLTNEADDTEAGKSSYHHAGKQPGEGPQTKKVTIETDGAEAGNSIHHRAGKQPDEGSQTQAHHNQAYDSEDVLHGTDMANFDPKTTQKSDEQTEGQKDDGENEEEPMSEPSKEIQGDNRIQLKSRSVKEILADWINNIQLFYCSPMIIFIYASITYTFFLGLFTYIMLSDSFTTTTPSIPELILMFWVLTFFLDEIREIVQGETAFDRKRVFYSWWLIIQEWAQEFWNMIDLLSLLLFGIGVILRFNAKQLDSARIVLAFSLFVFYMRLLDIFTLFKDVGPKIIIIAKMMKDLLIFFSILFVLMVGYGITTQAILFPHVTDIRNIIRGIFFQPYFQIYGELSLEYITGSPDDGSCTFNKTRIDAGEPPCPVFSEIGVVLLVLYMLFSNVMLLNLLIAMFSSTYAAVHEKSDLYWRTQRYALIKQYSKRPALVPPFVIISIVFLFFKGLFQWVIEVDNNKENIFRKKDGMEKELEAWLLTKGTKAIEELDSQEVTITELQDNLLKEFKKMKELDLTRQEDMLKGLSNIKGVHEVSTLQDDTSKETSKINGLEERFSNLEERFTRQENMIQQLLNIFTEPQQKDELHELTGTNF